MSYMLITNARIVLPDEVVDGTVEIRDGLIHSIARGRTQAAMAEDWEGDYLIPGLIELHTDNMEKHLEPRPGVRWPVLSAVLAHDAQVAAAGITTVLDALAVGTLKENCLRHTMLDEALAEVCQAQQHGLLRADHWLHLRCEVASANVLDRFMPHADHPMLRLVSVMDHSPGQRQFRDLEKFREYFQGHESWSDDTLHTFAQKRLELQARYAIPQRRAVVELCRTRRIPLASHDDTVEEHVQEALHDGMCLAEFPTTVVAAQAARQAGLGIIMGAPNVVRGGSHSGNVSAIELAKLDLLDCLSSDYVPSSLLQAAFSLCDEAGWSLPKAIGTVTETPASRIGFTDRGRIQEGLRGDIVRVKRQREQPVVASVWSTGRRVF